MRFYFSPAASPPVVYPALVADDWTKQPAITIPIPKVAGFGTLSEPPFSYADSVITVSPEVWDFSAATPSCPFRQAVASAFVQFLLVCEAELLPSASPVVVASSLALVQQLVAAALPLTFAETLFFRHGYMFLGQFFATPSDTTYVDLQPGMRLRIESEIYQTINPSNTRGLNGFVPNGTTWVEVGTYPNAPAQLGLNPFLTGAAIVGQPSTAGIGGTIDISGQTPSQLPYLRLCYPALGLPGSNTQGWAGTLYNATLLGAASRTALEAQTQAYVANGAVSSGVANFFNGRAVVTPEITVLIGGQPTWVPLGTTLRNVLERLTATPYFGNTGWTIKLSSLLQRSVPMQPESIFGATTWQGPSWAEVKLDDDVGGYQFYSANQCDSLDLPLLAGDAVTVSPP